MRLRVTSIFSQQEGFLSENAGYFEDCATSNNRNSVEENLRKSLWLKPFQSELNRIYTPQKISKFVGHPVHYLLSGNDYNNRSNAVKELVAALYQNNRVSSKRYCEISLSNFDVSDLRRISKLYDCYSGGTIVIRYRKNACSDGGVADVGIEVIEDFCKQIMKHKNDVLTVLCFPRFCDVEKGMFFEYLSMLSFVKLEEGSAKFEDAKNYLLSKAQEDEITLSDEFFSGIDAEKSYTLQELDDAYERYSNNYLKTELFPQYKDISSVNKNQLEEKIQSNSYEKLQKMIGLSEAKRVIDSIINYAKMQKELGVEVE
jgi:hypothetical protein